MNDLIEEIYTDLAIELDDEDDFSEAKLRSKIKSAIREVKQIRTSKYGGSYPDNYTDDMCEDDLNSFYVQIRNLALVDYNMIGMEGQTQHNENGINRTYSSRGSILKSVIPLAKV